MTEKTHFFYFMLFSFTFIFNFPPFMRWLSVGRLCFRFLNFFWWFAVAHCPRCVYGRNFLFTTWWMDSQSKKWSNALKIIFIIGAALILFVHFALKLSFLLCWKTFFLLLFLTLFFDNNNVQICFSLSLSFSFVSGCLLSSQHDVQTLMVFVYFGILARELEYHTAAYLFHLWRWL